MSLRPYYFYKCQIKWGVYIMSKSYSGFKINWEHETPPEGSYRSRFKWVKLNEFVILDLKENQKRIRKY